MTRMVSTALPLPIHFTPSLGKSFPCCHSAWLGEKSVSSLPILRQMSFAPCQAWPMLTQMELRPAEGAAAGCFTLPEHAVGDGKEVGAMGFNGFHSASRLSSTHEN